jgi:hypothetical protein
MTAKKEAPPKRQRLPFVEDEILKETVRKEKKYQKDFTKFSPTLGSLRGATPDKLLVANPTNFSMCN